MNLKRIVLGVLIGSLLWSPVLTAAGERQAVILKTQGTVEVRIAQGEWKPAEAGMTIHESDEIRTAKQSEAEIILDGKGKTGNFHLKEESRIRLGTLREDQITSDKNTVLDLVLGEVLVHAEKLKGNSKFEVRTPNSTTGVRGTTFTVRATPKSTKEK